MERQDTKEIKISFSAQDLHALILEYVTKTHPDIIGLDVEILIGSTCLDSKVCAGYSQFCKITSKTTKVTP